MTENDQTFDAFKATEPGAESLDSRMVNFTVTGERGDRRGDETSKIKRFHLNFLRCDVGGSCAEPREGTPFADRVLRKIEGACLYLKTQIRHFSYNKADIAGAHYGLRCVEALPRCSRVRKPKQGSDSLWHKPTAHQPPDKRARAGMWR